MEIISIIAIIISIISLIITGLIYKNAEKSLKKSQDKYLYELRLNALKSTKEAEIAWQTAISDVYHEKERINKFEGDMSLTIKEMFNDYESGLLKPSFENISNISKTLEEKFEEITEEEAKLIIRNMETINISLKQSQKESIKRFQLLYDKLKESQT